MKVDKENVRELFDYDPRTGNLSHRKRDKKWFNPGMHGSQHSANAWNAKYAGNVISYKNEKGYLQLRVFKKLYRAHRLIWLWMTSEWPEKNIDHINHDRSDNRWCNLRCVNQRQNLMNQSLSSANTSGYTGVTYHKVNNRWVAQIKIRKKNINLGSYVSKMDAVRARKNAESKYGFHKNHGSRF